MEIILAICIGVTLSAACGFRVFIPPLIMSLAANYGDFAVDTEFAWLGTKTALLVRCDRDYCGGGGVLCSRTG
ncbi:MAG: DUF4126 domain-containing protein [Jaaginema sp. PMC 1079.18]|nr:DUF4126 domain-containing protein [Jaaginema sp. PMC 1080.18]MEC4852519.1 DUF4126 domain-containing protein [Jaaginema sp. PMC 1079.18]MEC4865849.1 DUF4126 domain-containing protein [Jaaginema sp. PMC 1078.18]